MHIHPIMENGATVSNPYLKKGINCLERVQHQAARFIIRDYRSREKGCVTKMLNDLGIRNLQIICKEARLTVMYNVVNDLLLVLPPSNFLQPVTQRRKVKIPTHLKDYIADTSVTDKLVYNHPRCYVGPPSKSDHTNIHILLMLSLNGTIWKRTLLGLVVLGIFNLTSTVG